MRLWSFINTAAMFWNHAIYQTNLYSTCEALKLYNYCCNDLKSRYLSDQFVLNLRGFETVWDMQTTSTCCLGNGLYAQGSCSVNCYAICATSIMRLMLLINKYNRSWVVVSLRSPFTKRQPNSVTEILLLFHKLDHSNTASKCMLSALNSWSMALYWRLTGL